MYGAQLFLGVWDLGLVKTRIDRKHDKKKFKGKINFNLYQNIGLIICVRFHKILTKRNIYDLNEKQV